MDTNIRTAIARLHCPRCGRAKNACCGLAMHDEITRLRAELAELLAAIEAMRVAGGAAEFQRAFDEAKIIAARKGEGE